MEIPQEIGAAFDEASSSLRLSQVGTAGAATRARIDPNKIWRTVIDEDSGVIRVVAV